MEKKEKNNNHQVVLSSVYFHPTIMGAEEELIRKCRAQTAKEYGNPLPELIEKRLEWELTSIAKHGFSTIFILAERLVERSNLAGYLVGSRGNVASSFVAYLLGITGLNPLPPHYVCPQCKFTEIQKGEQYDLGIGLPEQNCPVCGAKLHKEGFNLFAEMLLGIDGDMEPDIDLVFADEYHENAVEHLKEIFGKDCVIPAGKADKQGEVHQAEGYFIIPPDRRIEPIYSFNGQADFCYLPSDMSGRLLRVDLLADHTLTLIKRSQDSTGVSPEAIPLDDADTMSLIVNGDNRGIPDLEGHPIREMIGKIKPSCLLDLVKLSGLHRGSGTWEENAETLIDSGQISLKEITTSTDDILTYLMKKGMDKQKAYRYMRLIRMGKLSSGTYQEDWQSTFRNHGIDEWFIEFVQKISYLVSKAYALTNIIPIYRLAWYKTRYPKCFCAVV